MPVQSGIAIFKNAKAPEIREYFKYLENLGYGICRGAEDNLEFSANKRSPLPTKKHPPELWERCFLNYEIYIILDANLYSLVKLYKSSFEVVKYYFSNYF